MKNLLVILLFLIAGVGIYYTTNISIANNYTDGNLYIQNIPPEKEEIEKKEVYNLVSLIELNTNLFIDLKYASTNNFTGKQIYPYSAKAYLTENTANKLMAANEELYKLGYRIKIWDAYRPHKYQYTLREVAEEQNFATASYIANPDTGSHHNRGASVDITLTDLEGHEIDMPTEFDHFGPESSIFYDGCTEEQKTNRELLGKIMEKHGFRRISSEWWHFDDTDYMNYPILEVDFDELQIMQKKV